MSEERPKRRQSKSKSGLMPRPVLEPEDSSEPPRPSTLPEMPDSESTTGAMPVVSEDEDSPTERDEDAVAGSK